jgi:thymidylate synthase (FAD)
MKILYPPGKVEILAIAMGVGGEFPLEVIELAGRTAYQSFSRMGPDTAEKFIKAIIRRGHESVIEHGSMTVRFSEVSRGFTHQLVRHRHCSITQESTRYVDKREFTAILPPGKDANQTAELTLPDGTSIKLTVEEWFMLNDQMYQKLREAGWPPEDARQVLPIGISTEIVVTTNFREWRHIIGLRGASSAHWEIRLAMIELLKQAKKLVPVIFDDFTVDENVPCIRKIEASA